MSVEAGRYYTGEGELIADAGLREARKFYLLPSMTTLLGIKAQAYGLQRWKELQMFIAGATLPRLEDETDEQAFERALEEAYHEGDDAAEYGRMVHAEIEALIKGRPNNCPFQVEHWLDENLAVVPHCASELTVVNMKHGYAGTTDYWGPYQSNGTAIVDFKTQKVKVTEYTEKRTLKSGEVREYQRTRKNPTWYENWPVQLAGYAMGIEAMKERYAREDLPDYYTMPAPIHFVSVIINTNPEHPEWEDADHPGMWVKEWDADSIARGRHIVEWLATGFYLLNSTPRSPYPRPGTWEYADGVESARQALHKYRTSAAQVG